MENTETRYILVMNAGSSSQKSSLYALPAPADQSITVSPLWEGMIDWMYQEGSAQVTIKNGQGYRDQQFLPNNDRQAILTSLLQSLWQGASPVLTSPDQIAAVGHRVVHGGDRYQAPVVITAAVKEVIASMATFAPVHNPANLEGICLTEAILGTQVPQVGVFDTAFHTRIPPYAAVYPIPYAYFQEGIHRYGFHGISHQYVAQQAARLLGRDLQSLKLVSCHLGNGCSLAAIAEGYSKDTTMGFTPLAGLMMGTRSGDIDPGIMLYWLRQGKTGAEIDRILNKESGFLGVSGVSSDLRSVVSALESGNIQAQLAYEIFIHRLRSSIGAMVASIEGIDALIFTAGIGENSSQVRQDVCRSLQFLGISLDSTKNQSRPQNMDIATEDAKVRVLVIRTQEDWAIAQECDRLLFAK